MSDPATIPPPAPPLYRVVFDTTTKQVESNGPVATRTQFWATGKAAVFGTEAECAAFIKQRNLTPLPDPALAAAKMAKLAALGAALRDSLLAIFASWTVGEQYDFDGARQAMNADLEKGDLARAMTGVQTFRTADTSLDAHRASVLAALTDTASKFSAVQTATTVDAVNVIV